MFTEYVKKYEKRSIISSIIMIIVAILLIVEPATFLNTLIIIFGIGILLDGLFSIILYFFTNKEQRMFSNALVEGILEVIASVLILANRSFMISILPVIVGIWIIVKSLMKLQLSFNIKSADEKSWVFLLVSSIITLIIGIIILVHPFNTMITIAVLSGILLLISGIIDIFESMCILMKLK